MSTRVKLIVVAALCALAVIGVILAATAPRQTGDTSASTGTGTRVAFYGDSYTLGTGATSPEKRWSTIVSERRNWNEFNPSVNGLGFIANRSEFGEGDLVSLIIDEKPEIVFVTMGLNDNFAFDFEAADIRSQIPDDLDRLKEGLPDARFLVVEPFWYTDDRPGSVDIINRWVEDAADDIGADYIAGASRWIEGHREWMADDGIHPNDAGYAAMAERMNDELARLGL
jgi:lysophospholipase L1-like esterase